VAAGEVEQLRVDQVLPHLALVPHRALAQVQPTALPGQYQKKLKL
tara:strand:+ start:808 stop:942 length:135 start_codon:yes stop_codon:yes gene_type:complete